MLKKSGLLYGSVVALLLWTQPSLAELSPLSDDVMASTAGQALIDTTKHIGDGTSANGTSGITYYTMGLDARMAMNANINHLQLGCGGTNGSGACDIDISNFSLTGQPGTTACPSTTTTAGCDAVFTRPAITLAISNDGSPFRQVVGFQLSAQKLVGEMTAGLNDGTVNGIKNLSGLFSTAATTGTTQTAVDNIDVSSSGNPISGLACVTIFGGCAINTTFSTTSGTIAVPGVTGVTFAVPSFTYYGYRTSSSTNNTTATIGGISSTIPDITLSDAGPLVSETGTGITINGLYLSGVVHNLKASISLTEPLGYLHVIPLNNPFSLSFEKQSVTWPGGSISQPATTGWFMSVADPVNLGSLSTPSGYAADISANNAALASAFTDYFNIDANKLTIPLSSVFGNLFSIPIHKDAGTLNFGTQPAVPLNLANLPLGTTQTPVPNCYGSYKFC